MEVEQKGYSIPMLVTLVVILIIVGAGGYFLYQKQSKTTETPQKQTSPAIPQSTPVIDQTANWKTYTNTQYSFSFKYPQELTLSESGGPIVGSKIKSLVDISLDRPNGSSDNFPIIGLSVIDAQQSPTDYINTNICSPETCFPLQSGILPGSILAQTANIVHYQNIGTFFNHNKLLFYFSIDSRVPNTPIPQQDAYKMYNQILSTFKFTQ